MALQAGTRLGPYEVVSLIGRGGMGEVWLASERRLGRKVALKLLPADLTRDADRIQRFEQEARAASALNHPNVCTIYALGEASESQHYIAMEFVEGETLRQRLSTRRLSIREALDVGRQVAAALSAAHAAGIIHRDIKPENLMLRPDGLIKVLDFGLAKLAVLVRWAIDDAMPEISRLADRGEYVKAFAIASQAEEYIAAHPPFRKLWSDISWTPSDWYGSGRRRAVLQGLLIADQRLALRRSDPVAPLECRSAIFDGN